MNKTVYLRDEEVSVWEKARELSGDKLSPIIVSGLKRFIAEKEAEPRGFERIELHYDDSDEGNFPKAKAFFGRWIISPSEQWGPYKATDQGKACFAVALTARGAVAVYSFRHREKGSSKRPETFEVFESLEDAAVNGSSALGHVMHEAALRRGVPIEELDI